MSSLCYIQARGGSKRFPRKAMALWNGKPMVADAIEKAQATGLFDYIAVSSDDPEILQIAVDYGVLPLWRSAKASSDMATDDDVAKEVLQYFPKIEWVCKMYPCIPLLKKRTIYDMFEACVNGNICAYPVDSYRHDSGSIYIFKNIWYKLEGTIALNKFNWLKITISDNEIQDINTPQDLEIAKMKAGK